VTVVGGDCGDSLTFRSVSVSLPGLVSFMVVFESLLLRWFVPIWIIKVYLFILMFIFIFVCDYTR